MGTINIKAKGSVKHRKAEKAHLDHAKENAHANWMGGPSYDIENPIYNLRLAASSCFFGEPMYYHKDSKETPYRFSSSARLDMGQIDYLRKTLNAVDPCEWRGMSPTDLMESAIDKALDFDAEATLIEAVRLRNEENIRTTPQVILVRAANHPSVKGTGLVRRYAPDIIKRVDELAVQTAYQIEKFGRKGIPNSLKNKAWRDAFTKFDEYQLAKYRMENRCVKTVDVMNLCHPASDAVSKLAKGELKNTGNTWESLISEKGSDKDSWTEAVSVMGHMALLRNLRNLISNDVPQKEYVKKLVEGAEKGKQLPFRYYSAYKAVENAGGNCAGVLDAIEDCFDVSLKNLPHFNGRTMSLCDNSGSAWGTTTSSMGTMHVAEIANLTAAITARVSDEGHVGIFGDRLKTMDLRKRSSVFEEVNKISEIGHGIGGGTEHGIWLFWDQAIKKKEHWDNVFIYSDMQAGHGGLYGTGGYNDYIWSSRGYGSDYIDVPKLIIEYRNRVNPDVNVFCVQVAGYQDTIIPEFYDKTYILGGWGDGLLRFSANMVNAQ
jgi:hypothetical protein